MAKAVKIGDTGTGHGGFPPTPVVAGSSNVFIDYKPAARVGDSLVPHSKPKHPPHGRSIASGAASVYINSKPAAITGGSISCGGVTVGSGSVNIGNDNGGSRLLNSVLNSTDDANSNNNDDSKVVIEIYWSYGEDETPVSNVSRFYVDLNLHVTTEGYTQGETVLIEVSGLSSKAVMLNVDSEGKGVFKNVFKGDSLILEGEA